MITDAVNVNSHLTQEALFGESTHTLDVENAAVSIDYAARTA